MIALLILPFFFGIGLVLSPFAYLKCLQIKVKMLKTKLTKKSKLERWLDLGFYFLAGPII